MAHPSVPVSGRGSRNVLLLWFCVVVVAMLVVQLVVVSMIGVGPGFVQFRLRRRA